jgi:O-antigen ligase
MNFYTRIQKKAAKQLKLVAYFMAFPNWVIVQNISFFLLILFYKTSSHYYTRSFNIKGIMSIAAVLFFIGAVVSVIGAGLHYGLDYFFYSLRVLPNYLYWALIIILIGNLGLTFLKLKDLYQSFFWGLISLVITYFILDPILDFIPFYNASSGNSFAFLLILFSPMATAYIHYAQRKIGYTIMFILFVTLAGFLSGSRSGSILTLAGCFFTLALETWSKTLLSLILFAFMLLLIPNLKENHTIKNTIFKLNERTFNLIYETEETLNTDFSYLTRLAMLEKGLELFEQNVISGVGIGNFGRTKVELDFSFEGGELISSKSNLLESGVSAHNSYISFLAEGGILLFIPFLFLVLYPIGYFIINFNSILTHEKAIFISIIFMCIHVWFISAMLNVFGWFVLGVANSYIIKKK